LNYKSGQVKQLAHYTQTKMKAETEELIKNFFPQCAYPWRYHSIECTKIAVQFAIDVLHEAGIVAGVQLDELEGIIKELEDAK
jgi:hypothetical protein